MKKVRITPDPDLAPIIPRYLELQAADLAEMQAALAAGDMDTVRLLGHRMKGTGLSYGFGELSRLGGSIEAAALAKDRQSAARDVQLLAAYLDAVEVVFPDGDDA